MCEPPTNNPGKTRLPLVIIVGPTAVGKTEFSIQLAEKFRGEIVSADSRLLYRGMDVGTAKPSVDDRSRVPHHLIDVANPDELWSLVLFQNEASKAIAAIHQRNRLPLLVGGTGQYVRAITQDWRVPSVQPNPLLRRALMKWAEQIGSQGLYDRLRSIDPDAAKGIDPRNQRRTVRALEVIFCSGRRFSEQRQSGASPYRLMQIGLTRPREELYARVDARINAMVEAGLVDEVRSLLAAGYPPNLRAFSAIGYKEMIAHLNGKLTLEDAISEMRRATRVYVRRQANWFKMDDPNIVWLSVDDTTLNSASQLIEMFLN